MSDDSVWPLIVKILISGVLADLAVRWLWRSNKAARDPGKAGRLVQPISILISGIIVTSFAVAAAALSWAASRGLTPSAPWWAPFAFITLAVLAASMIASYLTDDHKVTAKTLHYTTMFGTRRSMPWSQVKSLRYVPVLNWFRVEAQSGDVARLSWSLIGLPEFAAVALKQVPSWVIDVRTREILRDTAKGELPL